MMINFCRLAQLSSHREIKAASSGPHSVQPCFEMVQCDHQSDAVFVV